jgi:predicted nucleotidyltransferase
MKSVTETLHTLVLLLDQLSIEYAVMGGFAVRAHGVPRPTYDIDLAIVVDRDQFPALFKKLREYEFEIPEVYEKGWVDQLRELPLLKLRRCVRHENLDVDLFLVETRFLYDVMSRRTKLDTEGRSLWVVSPEDLVLFKLLANRPRDWGDIADVFFIQGWLDTDYMRSWAKKLGVGEQLEKAIADSQGE